MIKTQLFPYQTEHIQRILKIFNGDIGHSRNGIILCTPWGSGKTLMTIEASRRISKILITKDPSLQPQKIPILVITQKSITNTWISNGKSHYSPELKSIFIGGMDTGNQRASIQNWCLIQDLDMVITNYDTIVNSFKHACNHRKEMIETKLNEDVLSPAERRRLTIFLMQHKTKPCLDVPIPNKELAAQETVSSMTQATKVFFYQKWPVIIVDEGHESRNEDGNVFLSISQLRTSFKIITTASPFNNNIQDVVSLFTLCGIPPVNPPPQQLPSSSRISKKEKKRNRTCNHDYCVLLPKDSPCKIAMYGAEEGTTLVTKAEYLETTQKAITEWATLSSSARSIEAFCYAIQKCRDDYIIQQDKSTMRDHYSPVRILIHPTFDSQREQDIYRFIYSKNRLNMTSKKSSHGFSVFSRSKHACSGLYHTEDLQNFDKTLPDTDNRDEDFMSFFEKYDATHSVYKQPTMITSLLSYIQIPIQRREKTLVFVDYQQSVVQIASHIKKVYPCVRTFQADSGLSSAKRNEMLSQFASTVGPAVLISTHVFAQGVNIECANHVVLCDVWWNPTRADQSECRVMRPTQKKSVFIVRIIMKNTVEELLWAVSHCKRLVNKQVMKGDITPSLITKITTMNAVDIYHNNIPILDEIRGTNQITDPGFFQKLSNMLTESADVYIGSSRGLMETPRMIPQTITLAPFVSEIPTINLTSSSSSSSSSSSLHSSLMKVKPVPSRYELPPISKITKGSKMIRGGYHHRAFVSSRDMTPQYIKLITPSSGFTNRKREIIVIKDSDTSETKHQRID